MLPSHFVHPKASERSLHPASAGLDAPADGRADTMHAYPPASASTSTGVSARNGHSLQSRLFGPRGITSCTVQTQPPYEADDRPVEFSGSTERTRQRTNSVATKHILKEPRWNTWEFRFYALVFIVIVPVMCWVPIRLSQEGARNFPAYSGHLVPGWMLGRLRDDSDFQYKSFRDYVPVLCIVMAAYLGISFLAESTGGDYNSLSGRIVRPNRVLFLSIFTAIFVLTLHGTNTFKLLLVCLTNYMLAVALGGNIFATPITWAFNVAVLFAVHYYDGIQWESLSESLAPLDRYNGLLPRWQINFNITMLRLVSFALDYHWARTAGNGEDGAGRVSSGKTQGPELDARKRADTPLSLEEYSLHNYLLYALYPPLFIAGPIMTFNDFCKQLYNPLGVSRRYTALYAIRWAFSMLSMEFILHFMYVNAIKDSKAWRGASPMELSMIGFWNLIVVWLKLLLPWRFFRLWALADGVDAPENMIRCMANNYSTLGFWRSWHRSYNLWIVRYIYVPVGGAKNAIPATLLVFTFVALWHDLSLKLLTWGWLVTLFILPEVAARQLVSQKEFGDRPWYRHLAAAGGVVNVLMMMTANLVGFAIGTDGMAYMWEQLLSNWDGLFFMMSACATLFVGVQVMFEYREEELRRGIDRKC